jgi:hypothetical protein
MNTSKTVALSDEDAWAREPKVRERIERARTQRGYRLSEDDLLKIATDAEAAHREGREYHVDEAELAAMEAKHLAADD